MALDPGRTVADLKELRELTGNENGAQRVAWTDTWQQAREWLRGELDGTGAEQTIDAAGNQWFTLRGRSERALLIGGHIDSVPNGGWLDGALNVMAGGEVPRRIPGGGAAAAKLALEIRDIAKRAGGGAVCTIGSCVTKPGIVTSVVETCTVLLDQRNLDAGTLASMLADAKAASERFAAEEDVE